MRFHRPQDEERYTPDEGDIVRLLRYMTRVKKICNSNEIQSTYDMRASETRYIGDGDQVHDRFTALDDTREEKVFSFAGGVTSGLELAVWSGFGKNSCRNLTFWVTYFSSGQVARGGN